MNHMQSLKFEHKLYAAVKEKMEEMQQHNMSWIEVSWFLCRRIALNVCRLPCLFVFFVGTILEESC